MTREEVINILKSEKSATKVLKLLRVNQKELEKKEKAYEFAINELERNQPKVKINEFLDSDKIWKIRVSVNGELINDENIEFISERENNIKKDVQDKIAKIEKIVEEITNIEFMKELTPNIDIESFIRDDCEFERDITIKFKLC
ncbi:hypothetical protein [Clostridium paraputrificum]|uniref:hypothetical protein n=1 Tax=Clostridium paraputrificum TaxID=29363 RepID=UPI00189CD14F|nr:hypothetical protein [Clostridium paraputrificum]